MKQRIKHIFQKDCYLSEHCSINFNLVYVITQRMRNATLSRTFSNVSGVDASQHDDYSMLPEAGENKQ